MFRKESENEVLIEKGLTPNQFDETLIKNKTTTNSK